MARIARGGVAFPLACVHNNIFGVTPELDPVDANMFFGKIGCSGQIMPLFPMKANFGRIRNLKVNKSDVSSIDKT
jgi:hypothetical protein